EKAAASVTRIVFALGIDVREAHLDRGELVPPDPAEENLVVSGVRVPEPLRPVGDQRNGERINVVAGGETALAPTAFEPVGAIVGRHEFLICRTVGDIIS